ncbi:ABC transporter ATP-binding protein [Leucobacter sp. M11]|uniref:ABC transporter ATP-binding protein n=1 Tax=Leucobacter sp. M11 TaxID=2993565 RepID=UPI003FA57374
MTHAAPDQASPEIRRSGAPVRLDAVTKRYGQTTVLRGLDLELAPGELVALLGPSGCGKTTALRCLAGLEAPTSGRVLIGGEDVSRVPTNRRDLGMVFQAYSLFPHLSVAENTEFGLRMRRVASPERRSRVAEALETVGLGHLADRLPHELSGGQQQRVALARALVTRPRALLLDEPLSALDAKVRVRLREQIRQIQVDQGMTTLFVTHDQEEALAIADRVAVMREGRIEQLGTPEELYRRPATAFVAEFIGLSNRLAGTATAGGVRVRGVVLPVLPGSDGSGTGAGAVTALVRPEHLTIHARTAAPDRPGGPVGGPGGASARPETTATVRSSGFLGALRRTVVEFDDGEIAAVQHAADEAFAPGERVGIGLTADPVRLADPSLARVPTPTGTTPVS